jgi:hypothetical protein
MMAVSGETAVCLIREKANTGEAFKIWGFENSGKLIHSTNGIITKTEAWPLHELEFIRKPRGLA